jgi:hypothetical protein
MEDFKELLWVIAGFFALAIAGFIMIMLFKHIFIPALE